MFHNDDYWEEEIKIIYWFAFLQGNCCTEGIEKSLYFPLKHISYGEEVT